MLQSFQLKKNIWLFYLFLVLQITLVLFLYWEPVYTILALSMILFLFITSFDPGKIFFVLVTLVLVIPAGNYVIRPFFWGYSLKILYMIIALIGFLCLLEIFTHRREYKIPRFYPIMFFSLIWVTFAALVGFFTNHNIKNIQEDYLVFMLYGLLFFIPTLINDQKKFNNILKIFVIGTLIIAVEYIVIFIFHTMRGEFVRINPNQGQIFLFSIPLCIGIICGTNISRLKKYFITAVIAIALVAVSITLTRGLWIALMITGITMLLLYYRKINKKVLFGSIGVILLGSFILLVYVRIRTGIDIWTLLFSRLSTIFELSQVSSIQLRLSQVQLVLQQIISNPLLGHGLGKQIFSSYIGAATRVTWIDNSYLSLLWKLGLIGTIPFVLLFLYALKTSIKTFREARSSIIKVFNGAFIAFIIGFLFLGIMSPLMVKYSLNIIWITLIALLDVSRHISNEYINSNS